MRGEGSCVDGQRLAAARLFGEEYIVMSLQDLQGIDAVRPFVIDDARWKVGDAIESHQDDNCGQGDHNCHSNQWNKDPFLPQGPCLVV